MGKQKKTSLFKIILFILFSFIVMESFFRNNWLELLVFFYFFKQFIHSPFIFEDPLIKKKFMVAFIFLIILDIFWVFLIIQEALDLYLFMRSIYLAYRIVLETLVIIITLGKFLIRTVILMLIIRNSY